MQKPKDFFKHWNLLAGLWFGLLGGISVCFFWYLVKTAGGNPSLDMLYMASSIFFGGFLGDCLLSGKDNISKRKIAVIGCAIPTLSMVTAMFLSMIIGSVPIFTEGKFLETIVGILIATFLSAMSGILVVFWLFWPIHIVGAWMLTIYAKFIHLQKMKGK